MKILQMADAVRYKTMTTAELRETFLVTDLFAPGRITAVYVDLDRAVIGSAVPLEHALKLETSPELRADFFTERREIGVLNIGASGSVQVGADSYDLQNLDCLYIGRGNESVLFTSADANTPAQFYLLSYPAHHQYAVVLSRKADLEALQLGAVETCNKRTIRKHIWSGGVKSCQLVMGFTQLQEGSAWNTMPPHTHMRRSEAYLYFNLQPEDRVMHLMGPAQETRHLVIANRQVVVSPGWSIHAGVGTRNYTFCWGMGGENQAYDDMDLVKIAELL